jgi:hypothetical protein
MIIVTISVAALISLSVVGYIAYSNKNKAQSMQAKFESIKQFADDSAKRILALENDKVELSSSVVSLQNERLKLEQSNKDLREYVKKAIDKAEPKQAPASNQNKPANTNKGQKPKGPKKNPN